MICSNELLLRCLERGDDAYARSMVDHIQLWHLVLLARSFPSSQSKISEIWKASVLPSASSDLSLKHFTYDMFHFMMNDKNRRKALPFFMRFVHRISSSHFRKNGAGHAIFS